MLNASASCPAFGLLRPRGRALLDPSSASTTSTSINFPIDQNDPSRSGASTSDGTFMLPPIGALTRPRPVTSAYLEAVQSNSISSVGFTLRSYASAARPHTPDARMPLQLPPSPGGRRALKTYLRQRKDHGREDNLKPERSGDGELTLTDHIGSERPAAQWRRS